MRQKLTTLLIGDSDKSFEKSPNIPVTMLPAEFLTNCLWQETRH